MPTVPESCVKVPEGHASQESCCVVSWEDGCTATHSVGPVALKERKKKTKRLYCLEQFYVLSKTEENAEFPRTPCPYMHSFPHYQHLAPEWYNYYNQWTYIDTSLSSEVIYSLH